MVVKRKPAIRMQGARMTAIGEEFDADGYGCAAVICTAVVRESTSLMQALGVAWHPLHVQGDQQAYFEASFADRDGRTQRVITCQQDVMGMSAAAALATKASMLFHPRYLIMCGALGALHGRDGQQAARGPAACYDGALPLQQGSGDVFQEHQQPRRLIMKQDYEELELEVVEFDSEDVITTSPYEFEPGPDETEPGA